MFLNCLKMIVLLHNPKEIKNNYLKLGLYA